MIPGPVLIELQGLTRTEETLIARALPIMRIYIKAGGQRGFSGHCINLPQNVNVLASVLPRYPKDLTIIADVTINLHVLNSLPISGVQSGIVTVESVYDIMSDEIAPDIGHRSGAISGPVNKADNDEQGKMYENVYHLSDLSSFMPVSEHQQQELNAIKDQLDPEKPRNWLIIDDQPLNEYQSLSWLH